MIFVLRFLELFRSMENLAWDGPKWGREIRFLANPDLADILGDMDLNLYNLQV